LIPARGIETPIKRRGRKKEEKGDDHVLGGRMSRVMNGVKNKESPKNRGGPGYEQ